MSTTMKSTDPNGRPRAVASGTIFGGVDCYVFADGSTILSQSGMVRGLRGNARAEDGDLGRYLARLPEKYSDLAAAPISFLTPDGTEALGRASRDFVAMCRAYAEMYANGSIHKARIPIARNCIAILAGLADVGIDELVYRASNWHPAGITQAPAIDMASLRDSLRADLSAEFAPVHARLAALESQGVIVLSSTGPTIGEGTAELYIRTTLREIARTLARAIGKTDNRTVKSLLLKQDRALRNALDFGNSKGRGWHVLSMAKLADASDALREMLNHARDLAGLAGSRGVQLSLVSNANGKKGVG
jgi:hypothetical protein